MLKCDACGMMMKDESEMRMHVETMNAMMMHMTRAMESAMRMRAEMGEMGTGSRGAMSMKS